MEQIRKEDQKAFQDIINDKSYTEILQNKIYKKIITQSQGEPFPKVDGTEVIVHYTGKLLDGTKFDSSVDRNEPFKFNFNTKSVISMWDIAIQTMKQHEKALFVGSPDMCYGESGAGNIPGNACLQFEIELIDWIEADREYGDTQEERFQQAVERKQQGNQLFQQQQYQRSNAKYMKGIELLDTDERVEALKLKEVLYGNSCFALQKLQEYQKGYENGIKSLELIQKIEQMTKEQCTDRKEKMMTRVVRILNLQGKYREALELVDKYNIKQTSQTLEKELNISREKLRQEEQSRKELMKRMMGIRDDTSYQPKVQKVMNQIQK